MVTHLVVTSNQNRRNKASPVEYLTSSVIKRLEPTGITWHR